METLTYREWLIEMEDDRLSAEEAIISMVHRETAAWNALDAGALVDLFHPDLVWPWPPDAGSHDPADWVMPMGRFNRGRWKASWEQLFTEFELSSNERSIVCIKVTEENDGGMAVVDVDTLWTNRQTGAPFRWKGRACKVYSKVGGQWYFYFQTGLLEYPVRSGD